MIDDDDDQYNKQKKRRRKIEYEEKNDLVDVVVIRSSLRYRTSR